MSRWLTSVALDGVDHALEGNGGPDCVSFIPLWQRILETMAFVPVAVYCMSIAWNFLEWPTSASSASSASTTSTSSATTNANGTANGAVAAGAGTGTGAPEDEEPQLLHPNQKVFYAQIEQLKPYVLAVYTAVFCAELGYKYVSRTGIFLANPCHQTTILQLLLLAMDKNDLRVTQVFRFQMYVMPGAFFALAFPILNTRLLPGEVLVYYVQHLFILLVPLYLLALGGRYQPESYYNTAWPMFGMSIIVLYHFAVLQPVSYWTSVNLNCILCPAISDPLGNRFWRLAAFTHQCLLVPLLAKSYAHYGKSVVAYMAQSAKLD